MAHAEYALAAANIVQQPKGIGVGCFDFRVSSTDSLCGLGGLDRVINPRSWVANMGFGKIIFRLLGAGDVQIMIQSWVMESVIQDGI